LPGAPGGPAFTTAGLADTLAAAAFAAGREGFLAGSGFFLAAGFFTAFFFAVAIIRYPPPKFLSTI
jgi:hypothetical protein